MNYSRAKSSVMDPLELKRVLSSGLMSFPVTDFDKNGNFDEGGYRKRLEWLMPYGATVLFAAGGTGEGFSLTLQEHQQVIRAAVETCANETPIIAGAGYSTRIAIEMAQASQAAGAAGILLLPHYLTEANQAGLAAHIEAVCRSIDIGVVVYNRNVCRLSADTLEQLVDRNPNLIGFKDGVGDIEGITTIRNRLQDRVSYLGGLPTAEVYAEAYNAAGFPVYSSAVFNFIPKTAIKFYEAVRSGRSRDHVTVAEGILPALYRDPQPVRRLCGVDRQGRRDDRRALCRSGSSAAVGLHCAGRARSRSADCQARKAVRN